MLISGASSRGRKQSIRTKMHWGEILSIALFTIFLFLILDLFFASHVLAQAADADAGAGTATGLNRAWQSLYLGGGGHPSLFGTLANSLKGIGIIALVLQGAFSLFRLLGQDGSPSAKEFARTHLVERLIPNALLILLLSNNGAGGADLVLKARDLIFGWDKVVASHIQVVVDDIKKDAIAAEERKVLEDLKARFNTCISIPPKIGGENNPIFTTCIGEFQTEVYGSLGKLKNEAVKARISKLYDDLKASSDGNDDNSEWRGLVNLGAGLSSVVGSIGQEAAEQMINTIMLSIGLAYNILIELALMLMGMSLPLILMISLYKLDALLRWLPQLFNLFVAKLSYTIATAIVMFIKADAGTDLGVWGLAIIMGLGCPIVSIVISVALSGSMGSLFEREAIRAGAGAARIAGAGASAAGSVAAGAVGGVSAAASRAAGSIARRV